MDNQHVVDYEIAFEREQELLREMEKTKQQLEWIWANCRIIYFPPDPNEYPLEHTTMTPFKKDLRYRIEFHMKKQIKP